MINRLQYPRNAMALRPSDFKNLIKIEEYCKQGLDPKFRLDIASNTKSTITVIQWIKQVCTYMENRGLDSVFRMFNYKNGKEYYLLEKWSEIKKPNQIENWVRQLKQGLKISQDKRLPVCSNDLENLGWSGEALQNSISNSLWRQIERDLDTHATGPEVFKAIPVSYTHLTLPTILRV